jgi:hypothetical protein
LKFGVMDLLSLFATLDRAQARGVPKPVAISIYHLGLKQGRRIWGSQRVHPTAPFAMSSWWCGSVERRAGNIHVRRLASQHRTQPEVSITRTTHSVPELMPELLRLELSRRLLFSRERHSRERHVPGVISCKRLFSSFLSTPS